MQGIRDATRSYEQWLGDQITINPADLKFKHEEMRTSPFSFLRATFYRWVQLFPIAVPNAASAPKLLAIGDLHVENFGTWRDAEGRLVWGVNDFEEATELPFSMDLVRLATSIELARESNHLRIDLEGACEALIEGYLDSIKSEGEPFVLEEKHTGLRRLASGELRNPQPYWEKIQGLPEIDPDVSKDAKRIVRDSLPSDKMEHKLKARRAGLGSLGRIRVVAVGTWQGALVAREVKELCSSAAAWADPTASDRVRYDEIRKAAVRCHDPFVHQEGQWIVRRLGPDCSRIELGQLPAERDEVRLIHAMGVETANVHLGSESEIKHVRKWLEEQPKKWLKKASAEMAERIQADFESYSRD